MSYEYTDPTKEDDPHALPDVEVFLVPDDYTVTFEDGSQAEELGYYYAYGFPGCLWDSDPEGPFESYALALAAAREE